MAPTLFYAQLFNGLLGAVKETLEKTLSGERVNRILFIDDDVKLGRLLCDYFQRFNLSLTAVTSPSKGLLQLQHSQPARTLRSIAHHYADRSRRGY